MTPRPTDAHLRAPLPRGAALARGLLGWLVMCLGIGIAIGAVGVIDQRVGLSAIARAMGQAAVMSALVIPAILLLRRRLDRRSAASLGWARPVAAPAALGLVVTLAAGALTWVPAALLGWIRVDAFDGATFAVFLVLNGIALLFYEALPEELALRGYTWTNLRDGFGTTLATIGTTALFPFGGVLITGVAAAITAVAGTSAIPVTFFPSEAVAYVLQLTLMGLALVAARRIPVPGAVFVAVACHWCVLTIVRALLGGSGWAPSGVEVTFVQPDAIALVLVHMVLCGLMFIAVRRARQRERPDHS